jgi:hypothetical protein
MRIASVREAQRAWVAQWRSAAIALEQVKVEELRVLTNEQALRDSDMLLQMAPDAFQRACRDQSSGFVEQQRLFRSSLFPGGR